MPAPTDPEIVERAYELWAFIYTRNCEAVARHFTRTEEREKPDGTKEQVKVGDEVFGVVDIAARTIRSWEQRDKWAERVETEMRRLTPSMWRTVHTSIVQGSVEAARFNRDVVSGRYNDWDARHLAIMQRAADSLLDRAGHLPWTRPSDNSKLPGPQEDHAQLIAGLSTDELRAMALGLTLKTKPDD